MLDTRQTNDILPNDNNTLGTSYTESLLKIINTVTCINDYCDSFIIINDNKYGTI